MERFSHQIFRSLEGRSTDHWSLLAYLTSFPNGPSAKTLPRIASVARGALRSLSGDVAGGARRDLTPQGRYQSPPSAGLIRLFEPLRETARAPQGKGTFQLEIPPKSTPPPPWANPPETLFLMPRCFLLLRPVSAFTLSIEQEESELLSQPLPWLNPSDALCPEILASRITRANSFCLKRVDWYSPTASKDVPLPCQGLSFPASSRMVEIP